jgi:replicative DNA helicase
MTPTFTTAASLFGSWLEDVESGEPPVRFAVPPPFAPLDLRPGRLLLFGGAPGGGKTAAILQIVFDLLRGNDGTKALICNVEMSARCLLERVAARLSGVPLTAITERTMTAEQRTRVRAAVGALDPVANRVAFLSDPFALEHVAAAGTEFGANVLVLDYIQRFTVGTGAKDKREQLETAATVCRRFCDAGALVLVASAVARQKGHTGSNYSGLNLASFRGSSELEYGCDSAYLFVPGSGFDSLTGGPVVLECGKNRYAAPADIPTHFDTVTQTFRPAPSGLDGFDAATPAAPRRGR